VGRKTKRMKDVSQEEWELVNNENKLLLDDFVEYCQSIDRSPKTIKNYRSDLVIIFNWFKNQAENKEFYGITKKDVSRFQNWCIQQGMSSSRIRRLRSSMSSLSNYIEAMLDDEYPNFRNIINKIPAPSLSYVREKTILTDEQIEDLLKTLVEKQEYQLACFVAVLSASGMRKSEIIQCKTEWFFGEPNIYEGMYVTPEIRCKGRGSAGKKLKKMIIKEVADKYLLLWQKQRKELNIESDYLFVNKIEQGGIGIEEHVVDHWMSIFTKMTGVDNYAHCYRHYSATWLKRNGVAIDVIRDFFGHNDSTTTQIYIDIGAEENLKGMTDFIKKK
jgi:integrase/recombinase XerD